MSLLNAVDTTETLSASVPRTIYKSYVVPNITLGSDDNKLSRDDFPDDFLFGASTSALQTEGTAGGRGPSTWDQFMEGDIAVDSYHRYKDDVAMLKYMSVNAYRFSISWSRILPKGTLVGGINQEGIDFYNNLINDLIANGITPFVTLFHFDMPQALQDAYNGFLSKQIIDDYKNYVNICFENFGDRVKHWATFNEPNVFDAYGYAVGASFTDDLTTMPYIGTHNTILAHATAVKLYREKYQALQGGEIGISLMIQWFLPYSHAPYDRDATDRSLDFMIGWYMQPLVTGDYPFSMKSTVRGRLPTFTDEEKELIKGSFDFMTINYYTSRYAEGLPINANDVPVSYDEDHYADYYVTMEEKCAPGDKLIPISPMPKETTDVSVYPLGLGEALAYLKQHYENPKIYITENGTGEARDDSIPVATALQDPDRIEFIQAHLKYVKAALRAGVNVKGYFIWSLIDGMEPAQGYTLRMGLIYIDYLNNLNRIPKKSAEWLKKFLTTNNVA